MGASGRNIDVAFFVFFFVVFVFFFISPEDSDSTMGRFLEADVDAAAAVAEDAETGAATPAAAMVQKPRQHKQKR